MKPSCLRGYVVGIRFVLNPEMKMRRRCRSRKGVIEQEPSFDLGVESVVQGGNSMSNGELQNSPLHGLSAEKMLTELVEFYGWAVLDAGIDLKCLRIQPAIPSCLTFLKKAEWARNRVEDFYLYCFKGMPKPNDSDLELKPRERGFPNSVIPKKPLALTVKKAEAVRMENMEMEEEPKVAKPKVEKEMVETPREESTFRSRFSRPRD